MATRTSGRMPALRVLIISAIVLTLAVGVFLFRGERPPGTGSDREGNPVLGAAVQLFVPSSPTPPPAPDSVGADPGTDEAAGGTDGGSDGGSAPVPPATDDDPGDPPPDQEDPPGDRPPDRPNDDDPVTDLIEDVTDDLPGGGR